MEILEIEVGGDLEVPSFYRSYKNRIRVTAILPRTTIYPRMGI
jgi:hypothetical protein